MGRTQRRLERVLKGLGEFVLAVERNVIDEVAVEVVTKTPVDTGYARGNWTPGINSPPLSAVTTLDPAAVASPAKISSLAKLLRLGDTFFITNNADYIELLNMGYSPQAASQFVRRAVSAGVDRGVNKSTSLRIRR